MSPCHQISSAQHGEAEHGPHYSLFGAVITSEGKHFTSGDMTDIEGPVVERQICSIVKIRDQVPFLESVRSRSWLLSMH